MDTLIKLLPSKSMSLFSGLLLAMLWSWFAYKHLLSFFETRTWSLLFFCAIETMVVCFYLCRNAPKSVSTNPFDWIVAVVCTFTPLLLRPEASGILPSAQWLVFIGGFFQALSILSLNRSFALVAAKRDIKTSKMYRLVRHPLYASYILGLTGYVLSNSSLFNGVIYLITMLLLCVRMFREESHLALDQAYLEYMQKVPYRLIPFVF